MHDPVSIGSLASINISPGGVPKLPVESAEVRFAGVVGDRQRQLEFHGGLDRAVSVFSLERIVALRTEGHPIVPGSTGENLTLSGLDWAEIAPGVRVRLGPVLIEVTAYASPCKTIRGSFLGGQMTRISQRINPGWSRVYARVLAEGPLRVGDPAEPVDRLESRGSRFE
jgi:MOSC domain-containing protein YiiM